MCDPYFCANNSFCPYGQQCGVLPDSGNPLSQCFSDYDPRLRPYCDNCTYGGGLEICGVGPNYCLVDTLTRTNYCGSDCSGGQTCPNGYSCRDVIVFFDFCTLQNPACPTNPTLPCGSDTDCRRSGTCVKFPGQDAGVCSGKCLLKESSTTGICGCEVDTDCPKETCSAGECTISRRRCITAQDCPAFHCVDFNGAGGCLIGQNCKPAGGLTCNNVK